MRKLPYQSSLQFIQRPQLLWNDIGDRKLWRGIQWIRRGPTVPSRLSWNAYQSNIPKPRSGVRWKHGMRRFSEYGNVAFRAMLSYQIRLLQNPLVNHHVPSPVYPSFIYSIYIYVYISQCNIYIYTYTAISDQVGYRYIPSIFPWKSWYCTSPEISPKTLRWIHCFPFFGHMNFTMLSVYQVGHIMLST